MALTDLENQNDNVKFLKNTRNVLTSETVNLNSPLENVSLRANKLRGNIILGNYGNLTKLDVSDNEIELLDLSALEHLETLNCSRNKLIELKINGNRLISLSAEFNDLKNIAVAPAPLKLVHLDISYNNLTELPAWYNECNELQILNARNNFIAMLPENLFATSNHKLQILHLACNKLTALPTFNIKNPLLLQKMFLQCNQIQKLPDDFLTACENILVLNLSNNQISIFPAIDGAYCRIECFYATNNYFSDELFDTLVHFKKLRILHLAYNKLTTLPANCVRNWTKLEEIVLSGNKLQHLPESMSLLRNLRVMRVHSNLLQSTPSLSEMASLRVLDLAHNLLNKLNLVSVLPKNLQFLDLSCNIQLQVDTSQLMTCQSQRHLSLIDVSGQNRSCLPTSVNVLNENKDLNSPWKVGFSETAGNRSKLYISQLRLPNFCKTEGLFGIFDGELNNSAPSSLVKIIPKMILEKRTINESVNEYMQYTLLSAQRELQESGKNCGCYATLCHISREKLSSKGTVKSQQARKYILRVGTVGDTSAYLLRKTGYIRLSTNNFKNSIKKCSSRLLMTRDPEISQTALGNCDEFLVLCNEKLWKTVDIELVSQEIRKEKNVVLAAKRIQDIAQSFGVDQNLSIIIVKFKNIGADVDQLIKELKQSVKKKTVSIGSDYFKCGSCSESNNNSFCFTPEFNPLTRQLSSQSDRSSPSGQSDQANNELTSIVSRNMSCRFDGSRIAPMFHSKILEEETEGEADETDSALSEEQFKCWEYILEQNTQLLFDKELNTISKAFTKNKNLEKFSNINHNNNLNSIQSNTNKLISTSSPHLIYSDLKQTSPLQFISNFSKNFGSTRSLQPCASTKLNTTNRITPITNGPNAAYFGSLQRLMPLNTKNDFALMYERPLDDDNSTEQSRMSQYWGVVTTEL